MPRFNRNIVIASSVVLFHLAALWALQSGLLRRAVEIVVPVALLSEIITPPAPKAEPPPQPPALAKPVIAPRIEPRAVAPPRPVSLPESRPAAAAPTDVEVTISPTPPVAAPAAPPPAPVAPAEGKVELPLSDADYLQNPKPAYPSISKRLGEQGKVVVRVLIGADGVPQKAEIRQSSGFERLDQAALATALKWRYVPGKRGGVAEAMWFNVPINFVLE